MSTVTQEIERLIAKLGYCEVGSSTMRPPYVLDFAMGHGWGFQIDHRGVDGYAKSTVMKITQSEMRVAEVARLRAAEHQLWCIRNGRPMQEEPLPWTRVPLMPTPEQIAAAVRAVRVCRDTLSDEQIAVAMYHAMVQGAL